ncbi:hypothetical protein TNCT_260921, partial [Trichonephila clavata]
MTQDQQWDNDPIVYGSSFIVTKIIMQAGLGGGKIGWDE